MLELHALRDGGMVIHVQALAGIEPLPLLRPAWQEPIP